MAGTLEIPQASDRRARETQRTWLTAAFALAASLGMLLVTTPSAISPPAYWVVSSIAVATVLLVFVAGERAWDRMVASAQAAGVVER